MIKKLLKKNTLTRRAVEIIGLKRRKESVQKRGLGEIETITTAFNDSGICSFADFGTLLGLVRERKLLDGDADIDIGVILKHGEEMQKADSILESMGYKLLREFTVDKGIKEQSYIKHHVKIDLQFYFMDNTDMMYCYLFYNPSGNAKEKYWKSVIKKCPAVRSTEIVKIENHHIRIPENAEVILEYKYGNNWRVPDRSWDYWKGPYTYSTDKSGFLRSIDNGGIPE